MGSRAGKTGEYIPRKSLGHVYHANDWNINKIAEEIVQKKYPFICVNEDEGQDFKRMKEIVKRALQEIWPEKSTFEL